MRLPLSGEFSSVAEEEERRLEMTGSMCLDRFMVDTDLLSASTNTDTSFSSVYPKKSVRENGKGKLFYFVIMYPLK